MTDPYWLMSGKLLKRYEPGYKPLNMNRGYYYVFYAKEEWKTDLHKIRADDEMTDVINFEIPIYATSYGKDKCYTWFDLLPHED